MLRPGHQPITSHVVQTVRIELARYDGAINVAVAPSADDVGDIVCKAAAEATKDFSYLAVSNECIADHFMIRHVQAKTLSNALKSVAERSVPKVMNERRRKCFAHF